MKRGWLVFTACATAMLVGLVWLSAVVLSLERTEAEAEAAARHRQSVRLALWRMDSWLGAVLAREAARPAVDYAPYRPRNAFNRALEPLEPGAVYTASPLRDFAPDVVGLHFEWTQARGLSSPRQRPGELTALSEALDVPRALQIAEQAEARAREASPRPALTELARREAATESCLVGPTGVGAPRAGPLAPLWLGDGPEPGLAFVRVARAEAQVSLQGFLLDWPRARSRLRASIADLFPDARLAPRRGPAPDTGLAAIPVTLETTAPETNLGGRTATRLQLGVVWLAALIALAAVGLTLRTSFDIAERRGRFVSAVTHELRTPLTTFRMYAQMLADGMVTDPEQRAIYLRTLEAESERLSALVANVLAYARLEGGRHPQRRAAITGGALVDRVAPALSRRAAQAGVPLRITCSGDAGRGFELDAESVEQILFILVDNACKYAATDAGVDVVLDAGRGEFVVSDHGPGIGPEHARAVFEPFDRGGLDAAGGIPGVGLGLALARDLARAIGGELSLGGAPDAGAHFRLRLNA